MSPNGRTTPAIAFVARDAPMRRGLRHRQPHLGDLNSEGSGRARRPDEKGIETI